MCNSETDDSVLMVKCHGCTSWHCVECYKALQTYKHHEKNIIYRPLGIACIATFLDMEWDQLVECKNNNVANKETIEGLVEGTALSAVSHNSIIHLQWNHGCCPSCYNFKVPRLSFVAAVPHQTQQLPALAQGTARP